MSISQGYCTIILYPWILFTHVLWNCIVAEQKKKLCICSFPMVPFTDNAIAMYCINMSRKWSMTFPQQQQQHQHQHLVLWGWIKFFISTFREVSSEQQHKNTSLYHSPKIWSKVNYRLQLFSLLLDFRFAFQSPAFDTLSLVFPRLFQSITFFNRWYFLSKLIRTTHMPLGFFFVCFRRKKKCSDFVCVTK